MPVEAAAKVPPVGMHCYFTFTRNDKVVIVAPKDNKIAAVVERFPAAAFAFVASRRNAGTPPMWRRPPLTAQ